MGYRRECERDEPGRRMNQHVSLMSDPTVLLAECSVQNQAQKKVAKLKAACGGGVLLQRSGVCAEWYGSSSRGCTGTAQRVVGYSNPQSVSPPT